MTLIPLLKVGIIGLLASPLVARVWKNLRRRETDGRLVHLRRWQGVGITVAGVALVVGFVLANSSSAPHLPFWTLYAVILVVGGGVLLAVHANTLESRVLSSPKTDRHVSTKSQRYDAAWKVALILCFGVFFTALSVTSFRGSAWLGPPLLVVTYVLMGLTFVLAAVAGATSNSG
jgi:hypothetical protein